MEETKEQPDYQLPAESYPNDGPKSPIELVGENLCPAMPSIELDEETPPMEEIKAGYRGFGFEHMAAVPDSMGSNIKRIRNIKACPLRLLYEVPLKTGPFRSLPQVWHGDWG